MNYLEKYKKYKLKYANLKKLIGGTKHTFKKIKKARFDDIDDDALAVYWLFVYTNTNFVDEIKICKFAIMSNGNDKEDYVEEAIVRGNVRDTEEEHGYIFRTLDKKLLKYDNMTNEIFYLSNPENKIKCNVYTITDISSDSEISERDVLEIKSQINEELEYRYNERGSNSIRIPGDISYLEDLS